MIDFIFRKKKYVLIAVLAVALGVGAAVWAAGSAPPGSEEDPVVSKSYVDARTTFAPVELYEGQRLIGTEGTEIILRSGEASALDNGANGVSDLTSGRDLMTGDEVPPNHLLLVPGDDGRGITAKSECWVMVRGEYKLQ